MVYPARAQVHCLSILRDIIIAYTNRPRKREETIKKRAEYVQEMEMEPKGSSQLVKDKGPTTKQCMYMRWY